MGCQMSKPHTIAHVDDSVRVMLSHEQKIAKKKGVPQSTTYIPRAEHPLLAANRNMDNQNEYNNDNTTDTSAITATTATAAASQQTPVVITATEP